MNIDQVRAVITGGASGLGLAVARRLVAAGGHVALLDVNGEAGETIADALGPAATFRAVDVRDEAAVAEAVAVANEELQGLNVAICCAGIIGAGRALGRDGPMSLAHFTQVVEINLMGTFNVCKAAAAIIADQPAGEDGERGVLITTTSIAAEEGQIGQAAYAASKAGVAGLTLPLARELARSGIRVMTIAPGVFRTAMIEGVPESVQQALAESIPFPARLGRPEEFAEAVRFVIENRYLNGSTLRLDGAARLPPK